MRTGPAVLGLVLSMAACAPATPPGSPATSSDPTPIAAVHAHVCANCHVLPEPGTRTRSHLEAAFVRHARRVRLTPDQWSAMVDYLARR